MPSSAVKRAKKAVGLLLKILFLPFRLVPETFLARLIFQPVKLLALSRSPRSSLRLIFSLERLLFTLTGAEASRYNGGVHTKHRHTRYHDFFVARIHKNETVIDIGCGNGFLAYDIATQTGARVTAMDLSPTNIATANTRFAHPNIAFSVGNVLTDLPESKFDVAVLSNVLEHIEDRIGFLGSAQARLSPARWLIRVPMRDRDWRVPLADEVGADSRIDGTHFIEYTEADLETELTKAGLEITDKIIRWGEIWCEAIPRDTQHATRNTQHPT